MALVLLDGDSGRNHIFPHHIGDCNAGTYGAENYVLPVGQKLKYEIVSNNKITVYDGVFLMQGRRCCIEPNTSIDFIIENGTQGEFRYDILAVKYIKDAASKIESVENLVYKGIPDTAAPEEPELETGDVRSGANVATIPLYRVKLEGLNIVEVVPLFELLWKTSDIKGFLDTYEEIMACTEAGFLPRVQAVKQGFESLNAKSEWKKINTPATITNISENVDTVLLSNSEEIKSAQEVIIRFTPTVRTSDIHIYRTGDLVYATSVFDAGISSDGAEWVMCLVCRVDFSAGSVKAGCSRSSWKDYTSPTVEAVYYR